MKKLKEKSREIWELFRDSAVDWYSRDPFRNSTVISYYTVFAIPGLGVILINTLGYFFGTELIIEQVTAEVEEAIGAGAAQFVEQIIERAYTGQAMTVSSIISIVTLLFGATGVFYQVQQTLNIIWEVKPQPDQMLLKFLRDRLFSLGMVLVIGFLLLVSLVLSSLMTILSEWFEQILGIFALLMAIAEFFLALGVVTLLFAAIFKVLPDVRIRWKDVWPGALVTAVLFTVARYALGLYFTIGDPASIYGAAGSIILILLWTTYSGLILLYGAEFTRVYARKYGVKIKPTEVAVSVSGSGETGDFESRMKNTNGGNESL